MTRCLSDGALSNALRLYWVFGPPEDGDFTALGLRLERAIAGGGRYDELIELLGGPKTPACGFAMGDVVLGLVLKNLDRLPESTAILPRPDCFVIDAGGRPDAVRQLLRALRGAGLHARTSVKATRNVGKLLAEASKNRARFAAILSEEGLDGPIELKDLESGEQRAVASGELAAVLATTTPSD